MFKNRKLSDSSTVNLSFLTHAELDNILHNLESNNYHFSKTLDHFNKIKYIAKNFDDNQVSPFIPAFTELPKKSEKERDKQLTWLKEIQKIDKNNAKISTGKRGRKKSDSTLKDKVFLLLDSSSNPNPDLSYEDVLKSGIVNIKENTFKVILSLWRKENNVVVKRGRKRKET